MTDDYLEHCGAPSVQDHCRLRRVAGRSERAAAAGLPKSAAAVTISHEGRLVAMDRAMGDGLFYQIVDVAVEPVH